MVPIVGWPLNSTFTRYDLFCGSNPLSIFGKLLFGSCVTVDTRLRITLTTSSNLTSYVLFLSLDPIKEQRDTGPLLSRQHTP